MLDISPRSTLGRLNCPMRLSLVVPVYKEEKTIAEFKMWASMSRKPGAPSEYMLHLYRSQLDEQRLAPSPGEKHPEFLAERVWEGLI